MQTVHERSPLSSRDELVRQNGARAFVAGTYWWNHSTVRSLFATSAGQPVFCWDCDDAIAQAVRNGGRVVAWSARLQPRHEAACAAQGVPLIRIEDGFIRSIGLGAGFVAASSLALDTRGIYYDATRPSDMEVLLQTAVLSDAQRTEGAMIRRRIIEARLSKYNLRGGSLGDMLPGDRDIVLVPGQVADDASILQTISSTIDAHSGENINVQLLRQARARNPGAFLIYKPHPDVRFALRAGGVPAQTVQRYADLVATDADIVELIDLCDRVETISSLVGFEALLRGKPVSVHGLPFYAGWGLTDDLRRSPRRSTRRSTDELAYLAFARYTRHVNPFSHEVCSVHELIDALVRLRESRLHRLRAAGMRRVASLCERFGV